VDRNSSSQSGFTLVIVLVLVVLFAVVIVTVQTMQRADIRLTSLKHKSVKSDYIAESAVNWAISNIRPEFDVATHKPDGQTIADEDDGTYACGAHNGFRIAEQNLSVAFKPLYASSGISYDAEGWISTETTDPQQMYSANTSEVVKVKIWYPQVDQIRIVGKGVVDGVDEEVFFEADIVSLFNYGLIANGDIIPFYRTTNGMAGNIYVNGNLYLSGLAEFDVEADRITATGNIITNSNMYHKYGEAKANFINSHISHNWKTDFLFPPAQHPPVHKGWRFEDRYWESTNLVTINDAVTTSPGTNWNNPPAAIADVVQQGAPEMEIPDLSPRDPWIDSYSQECDCHVYSVHYTDLPPYASGGADSYRDFVYNTAYSSFREPGNVYAGYYVDDGTATSWDPLSPTSVAALKSGSIRFGEFTQVAPNTNWTRRGHVDIVQHVTTEHCLSAAPSPGLNDECFWWYSTLEPHIKRVWNHWFAGGRHGGDFVPVLWVDLSDPNFYPRQCDEGGIVDFGKENLVILNGDSLLYPITIYTEGEVYLGGDFNVGHAIKSPGGGWNTIWDGNTEDPVTGIEARINDGGIKGAAVVADGNRIYNLYPWFFIDENGFGRRTFPPNGFRNRNRNPNRWMTDGGPIPRDSRSPVPARFQEPDKVIKNTATYVGVFVKGAPQVDEGFYRMSLTHGNIEMLGAPAIEEASNHTHAMMIVGTEIMLQNGILESDWNPGKNGGNGGYDSHNPPEGYWADLQSSANRSVTIDGYTYDRFTEWTTRGRGQGYPPRPGRIAPRAGRNFPSTYVFRDLGEIPTPPGISRTITNKMFFKR